MNNASRVIRGQLRHEPRRDRGNLLASVMRPPLRQADSPIAEEQWPLRNVYVEIS
jgi:hypothetical protein